MAFLWLGGEDLDFSPAGGSAARVQLPVGSFDYVCRSYARCGISPAAIPYARLKSRSFIEVTSLWLSCQSALDTSSSDYRPNPTAIGLCNGEGKGIYIGSGNSSLPSSTSNHRFGIYTYDGTTVTLLNEETGMSWANGTRIRIDLMISNYGINGTITLYINGAQVATYTGDIRVSGVTGFTNLYVGHSAIAGYAYMAPYVSEVIIASTDTRNIIGLLTGYPNSDGTTTDWTGDYTGIDDTTMSDLGPNYTNTADQDQQYNLVNPPAGTYRISGSSVNVRATKSADASIGGVKLGFNNGGSITVGSAKTLGTSFDSYDEVSNTEIALADLTNLQVNLRSAA